MIGNAMGMPPTPPPYPPPHQQGDPWRNQRAQWKAQRRYLKMQSKQQRAVYRAYSRSSMVGPVLLVGIGVVALLMTTHRLNAPYFWRWYGHWWPLILIVAGILLALESLAFARYSRIRLGGGVVFLGIILALLGVAAAHNDINWSAIGEQLQFGDNVDLAQMFGQKHKASEQIDHALPADATLVIQNQRGDITISNGTDDQMHLTLDKTVYSNSDSDAEQKLQSMEPLITSSGSVITLHMPSSDSQIADMALTLPSSTAVQVRSEQGDITVNGRQAAVTINSNHGNVQLGSIDGAVHATMHEGDFSASKVQGSLTLSGHMNDLTLSQISGVVALDGDFFGDVHLEGLQGPVHFHSSRTDIQITRLDGSVSLDSGDLTVENATGPTAIATRAKDVELHGISGDLRVHNSDGDVEVKTLDPMGSINIENTNGSVQVTVPEDAKFSIEATAVDGEVHTDFNLSTENGNEHSIVSGSVGGGGPLLHITAEKGDITLHKGAANAIPEPAHASGHSHP